MLARAAVPLVCLGWLTIEWETRWHPELAEPEVALPRDGETLRGWLG